jgi:hypothetical protein
LGGPVGGFSAMHGGERSLSLMGTGHPSTLHTGEKIARYSPFSLQGGLFLPILRSAAGCGNVRPRWLEAPIFTVS